MIPKINKILYATDLSAGASHAFGYAISVAMGCEAKISIINVYEKLSHNANIEMRSEDFSSAKIKLTNKIKARMSQFAKKEGYDECLYEKLIGSIYVASGNPVEEILEQARDGDYDMIVMGTHGHGFLYSALIGSTARKMIKESEIPVLVVRLPDKVS
ncbi:universal stress protein [Geoalkalibacter halelectricus]|uniref:Universal stress protein n=1 Tax=Geoalkalibacter halelectricus TaxID=2847045 RepID=A0ABY5ZLU8_9BACT|nr:universal stress protein [Geoalkalibacter halelectricus]UWZ79439.1 universal stress protein [Geoalkalibacter halelectricus]